MNGRSATQVINIRPGHSVTANANYFMPGVMGGDHSFKAGGYWRANSSYTGTHVGGNATVRFPTALSNDCSLLATGCQVAATRDGESVYDLTNIALYGQDTWVRDRLTLQLGLRYDRNHNVALASHVPASPLLPDWLPAVDFPGVDPGIVFNNVSPRVGFTYDLRGGGKTLAHANWALYYGQVGSGGGSVATGYAFAINPVTPVTVRYPWVDANGDKFAQTSEIVASSKPLAVTGNWSPLDPGAVATANTIDPNLKNDNTQEIIVGLDHQLPGGMAVGVNYIWRKYANFQRLAVQGLSPSDWVPVSFTPPAASCPASQNADCPAVTYYQPTKQVSTVTELTNFSSEEYNRTFNGIEITARKRMANHWMANVSYSYNSTIVNNGYGGTVGNTYNDDPTNLDMRDGYQYDYLTAGLGYGNVYVNAKWMLKMSGAYEAPLGFNLAAFFNARQGYPYERTIQSPSRANGVGTVMVLLDPVGESRLPNYYNLDFRVERPLRFKGLGIVPSLDVFNLTNNNTIQGRRGTQNAANANQIQSVVAPRVARIGVSVRW